MCGIAGCLGSPLEADALHQALRHALDAIRHRGPDGEGIHVDSARGLGLGHRRLAIVDLSPAGHQPMQDASGRLTLAFNGEIYNHQDLRTELDHQTAGCIRWRGHSDTETLLAGFSHWGVESTLRRAIGMFAIALWNNDEGTLTLARDRLGEKPLYIGRVGGTLLFGSDLASLRGWPGFQPRLNRESVARFLERGWVPGPGTIYEDFQKLPPGHLLTVRAGSDHATWSASRPYWSAMDVVRDARQLQTPATYEEAVDGLEDLLRKAIGRQMIADVPLGAFLSGGIDSSVVVSLMQAQSVRPVKTFSIGFHEKAFDEAEHARRVALHLGTEHTELYVAADDALQLVPRLAATFSEPFADASQLPTMLLSELTRRHVTVALSGDGGDELFGGYNRHRAANGLWRQLQAAPTGLRSFLAAGLSAVTPEGWDRAYQLISAALPARMRMRLPGAKLHKLAAVLRSPDTLSFYLGLTAPGRPLGLAAGIGPQRMPMLEDVAEGLSPAEQMMLMDALSYLPDDVLVKVDRSTMATGLEGRAPLLDHTIFEYAWSLPLDFKIAEGQGKRVLRSVLDRHVPRTLIDRPKMGFTSPIDGWLRGALRDWAEALLDPRHLAGDEWLDATIVRTLWERHQRGQADHSLPLWNVLMFQAWREQWHV
jgi:asparagine synthase (glutamine-hydrolysing)